MPPLTSNTAFQPCCPGNQCWGGYWEGSQHALQACECICALSVTSCLAVKALLWGKTHWHISSTGASHTSLLQKQPFQRSFCINQCGATWSSHPKEEPMGAEHQWFTSDVNKWMWSHPKECGTNARLYQKSCLNLVLDTKSFECGDELRPQCKASEITLLFSHHQLTQQIRTIRGCPTSGSAILHSPYMGLAMWNFWANSVKPPSTERRFRDKRRNYKLFWQ